MHGRALTPWLAPFTAPLTHPAARRPPSWRLCFLKLALLSRFESWLLVFWKSKTCRNGKAIGFEAFHRYHLIYIAYVCKEMRTKSCDPSGPRIGWTGLGRLEAAPFLSSATAPQVAEPRESEDAKQKPLGRLTFFTRTAKPKIILKHANTY